MQGLGSVFACVYLSCVVALLPRRLVGLLVGEPCVGMAMDASTGMDSMERWTRVSACAYLLTRGLAGSRCRGRTAE